MSDLVTFGETMLRLSPPGYERIETTRELEMRAAGAESNVAIAADRLGTHATWLSKLPDSPLGRRVATGLHQHGIDTDIVWSDEGRQGTYYLEYGSQPRDTNVVYDRSDAAVTTATADELNVDLVRNARVFHTSGITPALSDTLEATTKELMKAAKNAGTQISFDLNYRSKLWSPEQARKTFIQLFQAVDVLILPIRDARHVLGYEGQAPQIAHTIASEYDFDTLVLTQGDEGSLAWHDSVVHDHGVFDTDTVDAIGTGDAFAGAFLGRRLAGDDMKTALDYAAATAALKRTIPGDVATITKDEVEALIGREELKGISR